jgi:NLR family CARD domain-containing protein 3
MVARHEPHSTVPDLRDADALAPLFKSLADSWLARQAWNDRVAPTGSKWTIAAFATSVGVQGAVSAALLHVLPVGDEFEAVENVKSRKDLEETLRSGLLIERVAYVLWQGIEKLKASPASTGAALNAKFAADGDAYKGEMGFGGLEEFFGGLEGLVGPPKMLEGSLLKAMKLEHCQSKDSSLPFDTSNGIKGATSELEWEFVYSPDTSARDRYVERGGNFAEDHPDWCRSAVPLSKYIEKMEIDVNPRLKNVGQPPLIMEELIAGRLYTGPCYEKYNAVLRFFSGRNADGVLQLSYGSMQLVPFLQKKCHTLGVGVWASAGGDRVTWKWLNIYATTIHSINSITVKMSQLTKMTPLYRGWTGTTLPLSFFVPDANGLCGGVEYGFSSTTTDRSQAVHYAHGKASTVLELEMGMVDRGADITWLSQCECGLSLPHRPILVHDLLSLQVPACIPFVQIRMRRRRCYHH